MKSNEIKCAIQDMIKDCTVATVQAEDVDEYKTADIYKGWVEALKYVLGLFNKPDPEPEEKEYSFNFRGEEIGVMDTSLEGAYGHMYSTYSGVTEDELDDAYEGDDNDPEPKADYRDGLRSIDIPITECDIDMFQELIESNEEITWTFETKDGESINVNFIKEEEEEEE